MYDIDRTYDLQYINKRQDGKFGSQGDFFIENHIKFNSKINFSNPSISSEYGWNG